jgi:hypothetical protein
LVVATAARMVPSFLRPRRCSRTSSSTHDSRLRSALLTLLMHLDVVVTQIPLEFHVCCRSTSRNTEVLTGIGLA